MEWFLIYLFVMIEKVGSFLMLGWVPFWLGLLGIPAIAVCCAMTADGWNEKRKFQEVWTDKNATMLKRLCKLMMPIGFIIGTIGWFMPSQKDLAIIVGSGLTYNVLTSETGKRIGGKAVDLLEQKIDEALKAPEKTEESKKIEGKAL